MTTYNRKGDVSYMVKRLEITWVIENGYPHYKVYDKITGKEIHCDEQELNETIWEILENN